MNKKIKILVVVGARPNFVKAFPLFEEFKKHKMIEPILVHTGQHYDYEMSKVFFGDLNIPKPDYNLHVGSGSHSFQTAKVMEKLELIVMKEKPEWVVVFGDVNSTLAGALVASKLQIPLAHIEAGLRSFDKTMPEEVNRVLTDHISDALFCPTKKAVENLKKEGITKNVHNVGDVMHDAYLKMAKIAEKKSKIMAELNLQKKKYMLLTIHRAKNTESSDDILKILEILAGTKENFVFPVHPRTRKLIIEEKKDMDYPNIKFIKPVSYFDMIELEKNASKIITDSGGVQKEAYFAKVPCITLREETEWAETVGDGWNVLVGNDEKKIRKAIKYFNPSGKQKSNYGSGNAAEKIMRILCNKMM